MPKFTELHDLPIIVIGVLKRKRGPLSPVQHLSSPGASWLRDISPNDGDCCRRPGTICRQPVESR
jgi:hypothetical protein